MPNYLKILRIDEYSITPIYVQLRNCFMSGLAEGLIKPGDVLPSINELSYALDTSRTTIERFYNSIKKNSIIGTVPGKGAYVLHNVTIDQPKVLLLFNKLSEHKKIIYDAFVETLNGRVAIDFYVYNNDYYLFKRIVTEKINNGYTKIVIVPYSLDNEEEAVQLIRSIPLEKLVIMDKFLPQLHGNYAAVYEDFEEDIYQALNELMEPLTRYKKLKLIFPSGTYYSEGITKGFKRFCVDHYFDFEILFSIHTETISQHTVYINIVEGDLVSLIKKVKESGYEIGKDIGIVSYNETEIKQVILNGITTISTCFNTLGAKTAEVLLANDRNQHKVPFIVRLRPSL